MIVRSHAGCYGGWLPCTLHSPPFKLSFERTREVIFRRRRSIPSHLITHPNTQRSSEGNYEILLRKKCFIANTTRARSVTACCTYGKGKCRERVQVKTYNNNNIHCLMQEIFARAWKELSWRAIISYGIFFNVGWRLFSSLSWLIHLPPLAPPPWASISHHQPARRGHRWMKRFVRREKCAESSRYLLLLISHSMSTPFQRSPLSSFTHVRMRQGGAGV